MVNHEQGKIDNPFAHLGHLLFIASCLVAFESNIPYMDTQEAAQEFSFPT